MIGKMEEKDKYYHNSQISEAGIGVYTKDIIPANIMIDDYLGGNLGWFVWF
jgi:hypothetical protein